MKKLIFVFLIAAAFGCKKKSNPQVQTPAPSQPSSTQTYSVTLTYSDVSGTYSFSQAQTEYNCGCLKVSSDLGFTQNARGAQFNRDTQGHYSGVSIELPIDSSAISQLIINKQYKIFDPNDYPAKSRNIGNLNFTEVSTSGTDATAPGIDSVNYFNKITSVSYLGNHRYNASYEKATVCEYEIVGNFKTRVRNDINKAERDLSGNYKLRIGFLAR